MPVFRYGLFEGKKLKSAFTLTLHKIPLSSQYVGYLPKGPLPDKNLAESLIKIGREGQHRCAFIKVEPNVTVGETALYSIDPRFSPSLKPLFSKYSFILDLTPSEEELLKKMHPKTRYNVRLAQRKGVKVEERTDDAGFEIFLQLHFETTARQGFHSHNHAYHRRLWRTLKKYGMARVLIGSYAGKPLSAWMLHNFQDTLYYPYGGSSTAHKEVMANNLVAWEAIRLGKRLKLKRFDMWGALGPEEEQNHPWRGFHRFKEGYGATLVEFIGTFDLIFNDPLYFAFTAVDKFTRLKVLLLKLTKK